MRFLILIITAVVLAAIVINDGQMMRMLGGSVVRLGQTAAPGPGASKAASPVAGIATTTSTPERLRSPSSAAQLVRSTGNYRAPLARQDREAFSAIVTRPLFSPTRRPPKPATVKRQPKRVVVMPPPKAPPLRFSLVGVVAGANQQIALLRDHATQRTLRVSVGDSIRGWRIETIETAMVRVGHKRWKRDLALYANK